VEAPRTDAPRPVGAAPAFEGDAGAAVVVVPICGVEVVAAATVEGFSGFLNKVLNGAVVVVVCAVDEVGVWEPDVTGVVPPIANRLVLGAADDVVGFWLNVLTEDGALPNGVDVDNAPKSGFD
jgi:hypothetical protein